MAAKLAQHWEEAFQKRGVDDTIDLQPWADQMPTPKAFHDWEISVDDAAKTVRRAGSTAPGPGRIPHSFWKGIGELGYTALYDVLRALMQDGSDERMVAEYGSADDDFGRCDFNPSLLVLIPKKPSGSDAELGPFFKPEDTRLLMLVDTSNRIIASVINTKLEPAAEKVLSDCQQGFLHGRSILTNVVEL